MRGGAMLGSDAPPDREADISDTDGAANSRRSLEATNISAGHSISCSGKTTPSMATTVVDLELEFMILAASPSRTCSSPIPILILAVWGAYVGA